MKKKMFMLTMIVSICLIALVAAAQQKGNSSKGTAAGPAYNPTVEYSGEYQTDLIFFKNSPKDTTWRRIPNLDKLSKVTCPDAVAQLKQEGTWQGHLKLDGSCGTIAEPADWAMGNRLNYDDAREQQGSR